jgi:surface antigen
LARDGLQALPAFACLALAGNHLSPPPTAYIRPWHRVVDLTLLIDTNHVWLNIILISAMLGAIGWALARGWLRLPARLILPLILCALIFVAIPDSILGTAYVAWRTTLAAAIVAIAALSPAPGRSDGRIVTTLLTLALGVTLINSALFALNAQRSADEKQAFLRAIAPMPYGARLFWAHSGGTQHALIADRAGAYHVGSEAVEARHAVVQSMFAYQGQQVLAFRDARFSVPGNSQTFLPVIAEGFRARGQNLAAYVGMFDYVLLEGSGDPQTEAQLPQARLIPVNAVGDFRLYAVRKSQRPKSHPSSGMLDAAFRSPDD